MGGRLVRKGVGEPWFTCVDNHFPLHHSLVLDLGPPTRTRDRDGKWSKSSDLFTVLVGFSDKEVNILPLLLL